MDALVVTHLDRLEQMPTWQVCNVYRYPGLPSRAAEFFNFKSELIEDIKIPVDPSDLTRQSTLTRMLMEMQSV
jgi:hypothetical protein